MSRTLAIIPARGGSTRVEKKNLRNVGTKPLIGHAVTSAIESEQIDTVVVSSDDEEIRRKAAEFGAETPFTRPSELATDTTQVQDVISHALVHYENCDEAYDTIVMLLPTTPFRTPDDIDQTVSKLDDSEATASISVSSFQTPPYWATELNEEGYLSEYFDTNTLWTDDKIPRSQDLPDLVHPNGAVFATTVPAWWKYETFYQPRCVGYEMPVVRSIDIDTVDDLKLARGLATAEDSFELDL